MPIVRDSVGGQRAKEIKDGEEMNDEPRSDGSRVMIMSGGVAGLEGPGLPE
jgi:hypothetical protein